MKREPRFSDSFYSSDSIILKEQFVSFASNSKYSNNNNNSKDTIALVSPHAGYSYSGNVAFSGFKSFSECSDRNVSTFIIIGPCHRHGHSLKNKVCVWKKGAWKSPFGDCQINETIAGNIHCTMAMYDLAFVNTDIHNEEHSIEVQVPFVRYFFPHTRIVPVLINDTENTARVLSSVIYDIMKTDRTIKLIISTDLSHYLTHNDALILDNATIHAIMYNNATDFHSKLPLLSMCGSGAVQTLKHVLDRIDHTSTLVMRDDSSHGQPNDSVVGYASIVFHRSNRVEKFGDSTRISINKQKQLLTLSRNVLMNYSIISTTDTQNTWNSQNSKNAQYLQNTWNSQNSQDTLIHRGGVFVTLKDKYTDELRGCIGHIVSHASLQNEIIELTNSSFRKDTRFDNTDVDPRTLKITISLLSELRGIKSMNEFVPGTHGLIIEDNVHGKNALYLPEVYGRNGLDTKHKFLFSLCKKGNIAEIDCFTNTLNLYVFTTFVFGEE